MFFLKKLSLVYFIGVYKYNEENSLHFKMNFKVAKVYIFYSLHFKMKFSTWLKYRISYNSTI